MTNYFSLFNIPEKFSIDLIELKARYQTLQKLTHPDRFVNASDQEKRMYMQKNTQINDAYFVLSASVKRGEHILDIRGFKRVDEQATHSDNSFLMQQMMLREQLSEATDEVSFNALEDEVTTLTNDLLDKVRNGLDSHNEAGHRAAADALTKLKFLAKLGEESLTRKEQIL